MYVLCVLFFFVFFPLTMVALALQKRWKSINTTVISSPQATPYPSPIWAPSLEGPLWKRACGPSSSITPESIEAKKLMRF